MKLQMTTAERPGMYFRNLTLFYLFSPLWLLVTVVGSLVTHTLCVRNFCVVRCRFLVLCCEILTVDVVCFRRFRVILSNQQMGPC